MGLTREQRDMIQSAVRETFGEVQDDQSLLDLANPEAPESTEPAQTSPDAPTGEQPPDVESEKTLQATAEADEGKEPTNAQPDVPEKYFDLDLSDLTAEQRASVLTAVQERDKVINRQMERSAGLEKRVESLEVLLRQSLTGSASQLAEPEPATPDMPEPLSDEEILAAFGVSPDDDFFEVKKDVLLPVAREVLTMKEAFQGIQTERVVQDTLDYWSSTLESMQKQYGDLPDGYDLERVLEFAAENGVIDPQDAYFRITVPYRHAILEEAQKVRETATEELKTRKKSSTLTRPRPSQPTEAEIEGDSMRDILREAAKQAAKETGFDWQEALNNSELRYGPTE